MPYSETIMSAFTRHMAYTTVILSSASYHARQIIESYTNSPYNRIHILTTWGIAYITVGWPQ